MWDLSINHPWPSSTTFEHVSWRSISIKYEIKEISFIAIEKIVIPEYAGHMDCY